MLRLQTRPHRPVPMKCARAVRPSVRVSASIDPIELTGQAIGLWVLFTTTTNWWFYRKVRKEVEKNKDDK